MVLHSFINRADLVQMQRWTFYFKSKAGCIRNPRQLTNQPTSPIFGWWSGGEKSDTEDIRHPFVLAFLAGHCHVQWSGYTWKLGACCSDLWWQANGASAFNTSVNFGMSSSRIYSIVAFTETQTIDLYSTLSFTLFPVPFPHIFYMSFCCLTFWPLRRFGQYEWHSSLLRGWHIGLWAFRSGSKDGISAASVCWRGLSLLYWRLG